MEGLLGELKLDVETLFNAHLHFDRVVLLGLLAEVLHDELLLFGNAVVVSVDDHVDEVAKAHHDSIVRLKLLLNAVKLEVIGTVICQAARGLQVTHQLQEDGILILVIEVLNYAH